MWFFPLQNFQMHTFTNANTLVRPYIRAHRFFLFWNDPNREGLWFKRHPPFPGAKTINPVVRESGWRWMAIPEVDEEEKKGRFANGRGEGDNGVECEQGTFDSCTEGPSRRLSCWREPLLWFLQQATDACLHCRLHWIGVDDCMVFIVRERNVVLDFLCTWRLFRTMTSRATGKVLVGAD